MKNLENFKTRELSLNELKTINGGSWIRDALRTVGEAVSDAWKWAKEHVSVGVSESGYTTSL